jgi:hypothetical protein
MDLKQCCYLHDNRQPRRAGDLPTDRPAEGLAMTSHASKAKPASIPVRTCRWIEGDVRESGWSYCGRPALAGRSWCADHNARAYRPRAVNDINEGAAS